MDQRYPDNRNRAGGFDAVLDASWGQRQVRLAEILARCVALGTHLQVATRPDDHNAAFLSRLDLLITSDAARQRLTIHRAEDLHEKGILTSRFHLGGSMNLTYRGITLLEEAIRYTTDSEAVSLAHLAYRDRWGGVLEQSNSPRTAVTEVAEFLDVFFAPPNTIAREPPTSESAAARWLRPWIERLQAKPPLPTVLPCQRASESDWVDWYALAFDERQGRELAEELAAFVGPSFSTFTGSRADLDPADAIDAAVATLTAGNAFRLRVLTTSSERRQVRGPIRGPATFLGTTAIPHPHRGPPGRTNSPGLRTRPSSPGRNRVSGLPRGTPAARILGADNLAFLKIQRFAALRRYREIIDLDEFQTVPLCRAPPGCHPGSYPGRLQHPPPCFRGYW